MGNFFKNFFSGTPAETPEEDRIKNNKKNFDILKYDGVRAQKLGQLDYAIRCYREALKLDEDFETLNYLLGAYTLKGWFDEALETADRLVELEPGQTAPLLARANLNYMQENYPAVLADCGRALELDERNEAALFLRAKAEKAAGEPLAAVADLTRALAVREEFPEAYLLRGEVLLDMGQTTEALADADRAIALVPEEETAYLLRGRVREAAGNSGEAEADYQAVIDLNPFNEQAYLRLGELYIGRNELDRAIGFFDEALETKEDFVQAYRERGRARYLKGDQAGATEDLKKALELDPEGEWLKKLEGQLKNFGDLYQGGIY